MVNFIYQLDWASDAQIFSYMWFWLCLLECFQKIIIWICKLRKADFLPSIGGSHTIWWRPKNRTKVPVREFALSACLQTWISTRTRPSALLCLQLAAFRSWDFLAFITSWANSLRFILIDALIDKARAAINYMLLNTILKTQR